ncbi:WD40 repeat-like protein [Coleophoma cylindrospora]|uniref:Elongator complex protein 2 n=1 Tax=Coleophoma cylindrospora TaxID=1849047 RepID=A0A3D8SSM4_9HELO|nr:WD40 repeat-like protein [Coleophoma cylindrospora]
MAHSLEYLAAGANRHPSAADWNDEGVLAYGADRNVALWNPQSSQSKGLICILGGHTDTVNAVKFIPGSPGILLTGSVDKTVKIWKKTDKEQGYECVQTLTNHESSVNCIAVTEGSNIFTTGSADATIKIWSLDEDYVATLLQSITVKPRFFPLALAMESLTGAPGSYVLAVAGTKDIIQLYVLDAAKEHEFKFQASLAGHEGWIRSLAFKRETDSPESDLLLASASQDKYIRLWRIHQGTQLPVAAASADPSLGAYMPGKSLSNKAHRFKAEGLDFSATFEALLLGHEDWIYSAAWRKRGSKLQLLTASADNSLAIWEQDESSSVWVTISRLGEISAEKGSTTATGSTGGFWTGLWSPAGDTVVCLGRTGSWRLWNHDAEQDRWIKGVGISGHTQSITGIAWSKEGDYILSTSSDQTTRLHARWRRGDQETWHEMARPQIHGYNLNCIDTLGGSQFVSGADEKLLRVFNEPKAVANLLHTLCGFGGNQIEDMPDAANMPLLGLSNKAIEAVEDDQEILPSNNTNDRDAIDPASITHKSTLDLQHPPLEDHLSRHTLWPETEKLYGHGFEISALAASHDGSVIATACKASSLDHAVIRLFETATWHEIKPPLTAHSLTVTSLQFSPDDRYLLSVGRDRQWAIFSRDAEKPHTYTLQQSDPKGHTRMILDAAWVPHGAQVAFATAGRDKQVKIWVKENEDEGFKHTGNNIVETSSVTAIDFCQIPVSEAEGTEQTLLAVGTESGMVTVYFLCGLEVIKEKSIDLSLRPKASKAITQLAWKPVAPQGAGQQKLELAIASEDSSLRIFSIEY